MNLQIIGQLSLSISFFVYCVYFLPQIWHNRKPENARAISSWLQLIYVLGYSSDWLYGAAAHLQWQYRCVSLIGILALCYQQWQMRPRDNANRRNYKLTTAAVGLMVVGSLTLSAVTDSLPINGLGTISMLCAIFSFAPQLISNYKMKDGQAISHVFISITLICAVLDMVSAICLHWPWPSLVSPPALFVLHVGCWLQQRWYRRNRAVPTEFANQA